MAIRWTLKAAVARVGAAVPEVFGEGMPRSKRTVAIGLAVDFLRLSTFGGLLSLCEQRLVRATARLEATRQEGAEPKDTKAKNHLLCKGRARATAMKRVVSAAKPFVRGDIPLICGNCTSNGEAFNHAIPNVEVTGAARLHRAASSDRRERGRPPGSAYTRKVATAMHEDLCDVLHEHGKDSAEYAKQLDRASRILRGSLPELLAAFLDYSSSSPR